MGKHSKNNNDRAFFSYHERRAANYGRHASGRLGGHNTGANFKEWGWGTEARTLDSDAMKDLDACSLSLQPCVDPVVTPAGVLYDKGVVLEYIIQRKKDIERETAAWEAQQAGDDATAAGEAAAAQQARVDEFLAQQEGLSQSECAPVASNPRILPAVASNSRILPAAASTPRILPTPPDFVRSPQGRPVRHICTARAIRRLTPSEG